MLSWRLRTAWSARYRSFVAGRHWPGFNYPPQNCAKQQITNDLLASSSRITT